MINSVMLGDCLELMKLIPSGSVDMILCDLPYGITQNKWDNLIDFILLWAEYERILKPNGVVVLTAAQPFASSVVMSKNELFKYEWIWQKTSAKGHLNAKKQPLRAHESVLVFYKNQPTYNPQKTTGHKRKVSTASHKRNCNVSENYGSSKPTGYDSTERYPTTVLTFPSDTQKSSLHPTQKPVALFEYLIKTYTNESDTVLDNCAGSGTTGVACINTNRNYILIEKEQKYYDIILDRLGINNDWKTELSW